MTISSETKSSIIEKIMKCFSLAKSSNENEAAIATIKAQKLLSKYNLTMKDISSFKETSVINTTTVVEKGRHEQWTKNLFNDLAKTFDCQGFSAQTYRGRALKIIGFPVDVEVFTYTYLFLVRTITSLYKKALIKEKAGRSYWSSGRTHAFKRGFCNGCCDRIVERIKTDREVEIQSHVDVRELVVVKMASVKKWVDDNMKFKHTTVRSKGYTDSSYDKGQSAANGISLQKAGDCFSSKEIR